MSARVRKQIQERTEAIRNILIKREWISTRTAKQQETSEFWDAFGDFEEERLPLDDREIDRIPHMDPMELSLWMTRRTVATTECLDVFLSMKRRSGEIPVIAEKLLESPEYIPIVAESLVSYTVDAIIHPETLKNR